MTEANKGCLPYAYQTKVKMFQNNEFILNHAPVCSRYWSTPAWIAWIDNNGEWIPIRSKYQTT